MEKEGRGKRNGEHDQICGWGDRREALRASRKNRNRKSKKVGGWGTLNNVPETWEVRDSQDSKGGG